MKVGVNGAVRDISDLKVGVSGAVRAVSEGYIGVAGAQCLVGSEMCIRDSLTTAHGTK